MNKKSLLIVSTIIVMLVAQLSVDARRAGGARTAERGTGRHAQRGGAKRAGARRQDRARGQRPKKRPENHPGKQKPGKANKQRREGQRPRYNDERRVGVLPAAAVAATAGTVATIPNNGVDDLNDNWASYEEYEGQLDDDPIYEETAKNRPQ